MPINTWEGTDRYQTLRLRDDPSTHAWGAKWKRRAIAGWVVAFVLAALLLLLLAELARELAH